MITYFKSQKDLADSLITVIDTYWRLEITEQELIDYLHSVYKKNKDKIINKENEPTSVIKQRLGKKRLNLTTQILSINQEENTK